VYWRCFNQRGENRNFFLHNGLSKNISSQFWDEKKNPRYYGKVHNSKKKNRNFKLRKLWKGTDYLHAAYKTIKILSYNFCEVLSLLTCTVSHCRC
jgi:hypothetical protein